MTRATHNSAGQQVGKLVDILKLSRGNWISRPELAEHIGSKPDTVAKWVRPLVQQGLLIERMGAKKEGTKGQCPMVYALAPEWGGQAVQQAEATA